MKISWFLTAFLVFGAGGCTAKSSAAPGGETFDHLKESTVGKQNGWQSNARATVQTRVNAQVGGKALRLDFPDGQATKTFAPDGLMGIVSLEWKVLLDPKTVEPSAKVLFFVRDSEQKLVTLFFHEQNNRWGIKSGANYQTLPHGDIGGKWQTIRLVLNANDKTVSAYSLDGATVQTLFSKVKWDDQNAKNFASLSIVRNGQGNDAPVFVDEISLKTGISDAAPAAAMQPSVLSAQTLKTPNFPVFKSGENVQIALGADRTANASADTLEWELLDWRGQNFRKGNLAVAGAKWRENLSFEALPAGNYHLAAQLKNGDDVLPAQGSRPANLMTFGVLPDIAPIAGELAENSRFGTWGNTQIPSQNGGRADLFAPLTTTLGARWNSILRRWADLEPDRAGQWQPKSLASANAVDEDLARHQMAYIVAVDGIPAWNADFPAGKSKPDGKWDILAAQAYAPKDFNAYADFLKKVAREQVQMRAKNSGSKHSYYLIHHEPDWHWKGDDASFIEMYRVAHRALHEADPNAILLGPRYGVLKTGVGHLERLLPQGLGKYLDGIFYHGYYLPPRISQTPENAQIPDLTRRLHDLTRQYLKPNAPVFQGEWGVRYESSYENLTSEVWRQQAAQTVRGHLIALGEGADASYLFYSSDFSQEPGYGLTFNLDMATQNYGARRISPKTSFMAACAMTRLLEGTQSLGRVEKGAILGYNFKRGARFLTALWSPNGATKANLQSAARVQIYDLMGQKREQNGRNFALDLDDAPTYVLSDAPLVWR